jgi:hypothetical protein
MVKVEGSILLDLIHIPIVRLQGDMPYKVSHTRWYLLAFQDRLTIT